MRLGVDGERRGRWTRAVDDVQCPRIDVLLLFSWSMEGRSQKTVLEQKFSSAPRSLPCGGNDEEIKLEAEDAPEGPHESIGNKQRPDDVRWIVE